MRRDARVGENCCPPVRARGGGSSGPGGLFCSAWARKALPPPPAGRGLAEPFLPLNSRAFAEDPCARGRGDAQALPRAPAAAGSGRRDERRGARGRRPEEEEAALTVPGIPGPARLRPSRPCPAAALPAPRRQRAQPAVAGSSAGAALPPALPPARW